MLQSLYIKNFALIDDVEVTFGARLNIVTGETGAGKSMLIDAIMLALGGRASVDFIRSGREKATVQANFDLTQQPELAARAGELGVECDDDNLLILARDITRSGKNYCRVNGRLVSLNIYREVSSGLVDMLGQHEQHTLLNRDRHLRLLDRLGGQETADWVQRIKDIFRRWQHTSGELNKLEQNAREIARRVDMLEFQVKEINKANLSEDEEDELLLERRLLANAENIARLAGEVYNNLYSGGKGVTAAVDTVGKSVTAIKELANIDSNLNSLHEALEGTLYQLEDVAREISSYRDRVEYNPDRLDQIEHRLTLIKQLQYKYGATIGEIIKYRDQAQSELGNLSNVSEKTLALKATIDKLSQDWRREALGLGQLRQKLAMELEQKAANELRQLEMAGVEFKVGIGFHQEMSAKGMEEIEFLIAPNAGDPPRPLNKIASGGELSRIMLVLKLLMAGVDEVPTLIFDEVDTGVGGKALQAIGEKLAQISQTRQVICVTHAPQVACFADEHFLIRKTILDGQAKTSVYLLEESDRVEELARMLAGREITPLIKDHARQMIKMSAEYK